MGDLNLRLISAAIIFSLVAPDSSGAAETLAATHPPWQLLRAHRQQRRNSSDRFYPRGGPGTWHQGVQRTRICHSIRRPVYHRPYPGTGDPRRAIWKTGTRRALALMKPTAFLVNTARGGLVDEASLISALREKRLAGAALDVISQEPPSADHPMTKAAQDLDNLLVTPHCAWSAREARQRLLDEVAENILAFTKGQERNCVV